MAICPGATRTRILKKQGVGSTFTDTDLIPIAQQAFATLKMQE